MQARPVSIAGRYSYGAAETDAAAALSIVPAEQTDKLLAAIGRQIACISIAQVADLEWALASGTDAVVKRMKDHALEKLTPAFLRLAAPIEVLVFDARKHRGERSLAWRWFVKHGDTVVRATQQAGWASGDTIYVWNRQNGRLVGFPACAPGRIPPNCVDVRTFLQSLKDPRAIGLGDCALASLLAQGPAKIGADDRFTCPSLPCGENPAEPGTEADRTRAAEQLGMRWPSVAREERAPRREDPASQLCRKSGDDSAQGGGPLGDSCLASIFGKENNPYDSYLACTSKVLGVGEQPEIGGQLAGVPVGAKCGLSDGEVPKTTTPGKAPSKEDLEKKKQEEERQRKAEAERKKQEEAARKAEEEAKQKDRNTLAAQIAKLHNTTTKEGTPRSGATPQRQAALEDIYKKALDAEAKGLITQAERDFFLNERDAHMMKEPFDQLVQTREESIRRGFMDPLRRDGGSHDCVDAADCTGSCGGIVGQIVSGLNNCTDDLLNALAQATGRPDRKKVGRKLGWVSIWDPDHAPLDEDAGANACVMGDTGPSREPAACGLMMCRDGALSTSVAGRCCVQNEGGFRPVTRDCRGVDCAPDQIMDANCRCQPAEGQPATGRGPRGPVDVDPSLARAIPMRPQ